VSSTNGEGNSSDCTDGPVGERVSLSEHAHPALRPRQQQRRIMRARADFGGFNMGERVGNRRSTRGSCRHSDFTSMTAFLYVMTGNFSSLSSKHLWSARSGISHGSIRTGNEIKWSVLCLSRPGVGVVDFKRGIIRRRRIAREACDDASGPGWSHVGGSSFLTSVGEKKKCGTFVMPEEARVLCGFACLARGGGLLGMAGMRVAPR